MTATGIHLLDLSVQLLGPAESVLCICEQLSSDLPQGDTVAAYIKFRGGGKIVTVELPPAEPVKDNLVAFARAVRGVAPYPITAAHLIDNIALLEAVFASALSGKIQAVA
jgi:predicted dehydrogenase